MNATPPAVALEVQIACVRREIRQRQRVYKRLVEDGRMPARLAAQEVTAMQGVLATLTALLEARQMSLFEGN